MAYRRSTRLTNGWTNLLSNAPTAGCPSLQAFSSSGGRSQGVHHKATFSVRSPFRRIVSMWRAWVPDDTSGRATVSAQHQKQSHVFLTSGGQRKPFLEHPLHPSQAILQGCTGFCSQGLRGPAVRGRKVTRERERANMKKEYNKEKKKKGKPETHLLQLQQEAVWPAPAGSGLFTSQALASGPINEGGGNGWREGRRSTTTSGPG